MKGWLAKWASKTPGNHTHLLLNGGKLHVSDQQHSTFLNEYANAVARGIEKLYVVESRTPIFRLFVDFDFKPIPDEDIIRGAIQSAAGIAGYYFDDPTDAGACILRKDIESPDKIGVHMTWDNVYVDVVTANSFRNHVVAKLTDACPEVDWKDVVDPSVYAGSGLRMPWSSKTNAPGVYVPVHVCSSKGKLQPLQKIVTAQHIRHWIRKTCIRAPDAMLTKTCVTSSVHNEERTCLTIPHVQSSVPVDIATHAEVLAKFHSILPETYADQQFTGMHRFGDFCVILRSSSKKCGNKAYQEHHSNTVYFVLLKKGVGYQRCYCRKDVVRQGGVTCTDYIGPHWTLPTEVIEGLWPSTKPGRSALDAMLMMTRPPLKRKKKELKEPFRSPMGPS
jgi:hypothetical protein